MQFSIFNRIFCLTLMILLFLLTPNAAHAHGVLPAQDPSPLVAHGTDKRGLLALTLRADRAIAPGEVVTLVVETTPTVDAERLTIQWLLPDGGELVGSAETVLPRVVAKERILLQRQVRFPTAGIYQVSVVASYAVGEPLQVSAAGVLVFTVQPDGAAAVSHHDPRIDITQQRRIPTTVTVEESVRTADANGDPCFTINGTVTRLERTPLPTGMPPYMDSRVPVRNVPVDMMEEDTLFDDYYGTKLTDANGNFNFSFCDDDGWFDDELELYVLLRAEIWDGQGRKVVEVVDSSWIDEVHEFESGRQDSEGGTLRFDMTMDLNHNPANIAAGATFQSEVFNIAEAAYRAWLFWNTNGGAIGDDAIFANTTTLHYEPGYDDDGSYYDPFWNEITIADAPSDPDAWDDSVVIHEWNHFADDVYGCDDSPGGDHSFFANTGDTELAWSEGYANYYQGVVRATNGDPNAHIYIDVNGGGNPGQANLESWNTISTTLNSVYNEGAIAAMLWDLQDGVNDGNDRVGYGHRVTQEVFTDPAFESNGDIFDDTCNVYVYLRAWQAMGKPATLDTAAAVSQNIGYTPPTFTGLMTAAAQQVTAAVLQTISAINVPPTALTTDYRWWKQLTWVVDNSTSMTGAKLDGTKTVINEQLNDLANDPRGVDFNLYTFNHESNSNHKIFENEFYADRITPAINGLAATNSFDLDCGSTVNGLQAAKGALVGKRAGDLWLFTDGIDSQSPRVDTLVQQLNRQQVKGSIALLGGCATPPADPNRLNGLESYVGNAAGPQSSGIVPYLVTALRSGGQFLYVSPDQLGLASDILRAQLANSAGAGRWSDYVSDIPLYRWDKLDANEYKWIDTSVAAGGTFVGQPYNRAIQVFFPQPFTIYGQTTSFGWVQDDGYILMGNQLNAPTLDVLYAPLNWKFRTCGPRMAASPEDVPCETPFVEVFTKQEGPWFAITTTGIGDTLADGARAYQALLDSATGEIRYQYQAVESVDAGKAEIAVTDIANNQRMLVSNKDVNGATPGTGYKFYWAPPQPAKTFDVAVDALMEGVGFLLTGYSGDFEQMIVRTPDGNPVSCADTANVLCLNLGKVQYIQVNVNGRSGTWTATVDAAAPSNQGTFSFIATAASTVGAEVLTDHSLYSKGAHRILVKVGRTADNNVLTGWFQKPKGTSLGDQFALYDDGAHDDLFAGDGYFGSDPVTPGLGAAYLWVSGTADGVSFQRADPVLFNFQPFQLSTTTTQVSNDNDIPVAIPVSLTNGDGVTRCFTPDVTLPDTWASWSYQWDYNYFAPLCLAAGQTRQQILTINPAWYEAASGATAEVTVSFSDINQLGIDDSITVIFMRQRAALNVQLDNAHHSTYLRPNGTDTAEMQVAVFDEQGVFVADGTPVQIQTTLGTVNPTAGVTQNGIVTFTFTTGTTEGDAVITASAGPASDSTTLYLRNPLPNAIELAATPTNLSDGSTASTLVATVRDKWGDPAANQLVRLGVSGDTQLGTLTGETEVMTMTTDANGQVAATFTKLAGAAGLVDVRAELLVNEGGTLKAGQKAQTNLNLGGTVIDPNQPNALYLPIVNRDGGATTQPDLILFADGPAAGWEDWSWDSTIDLASTVLTHDGSQSVAITHNAFHAGFSLRAPVALDATRYSAIRFWIYGAAGGTPLTLYTEGGDDGPLSPQAHAFTVPADTWTQMTVPLSALGNPTLIKRVTLQDNGGAAATYYVDELQLVGK